jgi:hypothetical protein
MRTNRNDRMGNAMKLLIAIILVIGCQSCGIRKVTVHGQYGEYSFKPYRPIEIETDSK